METEMIDKLFLELSQFSTAKTKEVIELERKVLALQEFAIWMTGCGYDFCQHKYFCEQRDLLLLEKENVLEKGNG
jgi:hypothetical protein